MGKKLLLCLSIFCFLPLATVAYDSGYGMEAAIGAYAMEEMSTDYDSSYGMEASTEYNSGYGMEATSIEDDSNYGMEEQTVTSNVQTEPSLVDSTIL